MSKDKCQPWVCVALIGAVLFGLYFWYEVVSYLINWWEL